MVSEMCEKLPEPIVVDFGEKFADRMTFLGRNGVYKQSGINVSMVIGNPIHPKRVMLSPITSKGEVGRAWLEIPKEKIPELIKALQEIGGL